jgi:hypothetical protein
MTAGGAIAMTANKITGLANGTVSSDAAAFGQIGGVGGTNAAGYIIGTVVQIVQATNTNSTTTNSASYVGTGTTATITPRASTHKIKVSVTGTLNNGNAQTNHSYVSIFNGSTDFSNGNGFAGIFSDTAIGITVPCCLVYIDSPATTSATTYTVKIKSSNGVTNTIWNALSGTAVILLEEIAQ